MSRDTNTDQSFVAALAKVRAEPWSRREGTPIVNAIIDAAAKEFGRDEVLEFGARVGQKLTPVARALERRNVVLAEILRIACPDDIEERCDECAPGPCVGCWVGRARKVLAANEEPPNE